MTNFIPLKETLVVTNAIANAGLPRFHRDRQCLLKHLKSLHTFPEKSGQVVLADS
jgi:hypothetical protein